jgi:hypothetical protein
MMYRKTSRKLSFITQIAGTGHQAAKILSAGLSPHVAWSKNFENL